MINEQPQRIKHSYTQTLAAAPELVFPLLCPVREMDWTPDWDPVKVISQSGTAEKECMFITRAEPADAVWIITHHDPVAFTLEMYKVIPGHTVAKLEISLTAAGTETTHADVSYEYTLLGEAGVGFLEGFTAAWYEQFMLEWERALNHYLKTGSKIG